MATILFIYDYLLYGHFFDIHNMYSYICCTMRFTFRSASLQQQQQQQQEKQIISLSPVFVLHGECVCKKRKRVRKKANNATSLLIVVIYCKTRFARRKRRRRREKKQQQPTPTNHAITTTVTTTTNYTTSKNNNNYNSNFICRKRISISIVNCLQTHTHTQRIQAHLH